jgi:hypothetical protein
MAPFSVVKAAKWAGTTQFLAIGLLFRQTIGKDLNFAALKSIVCGFSISDKAGTVQRSTQAVGG